jgi:hypothetical protein
MYENWKLAAFVALVGCAHGAPPPAAVDVDPTARYEITIFDNFDGAKVRACFEGFVLSHLSPVDSEAARGMMVARSDRGALEVRAGRIELPAPESSVCVSYETRFVDEVFRTRDTRAVIVSQSEWLWRPEPFPSDLDASVSFSLPSGTRVSLPWTGHGVSYKPDEDAFYRSGYNVFGVFSEERFSVGDTSVTVARLGPQPADEAVRQWLTRAIGAVASVGSELPVKRLHFVIVPVDGMDRPVAFGMVRRGGGVSVLLIPSTTAEAHELEADWVAIHELSHLWLPRLYRQDRWLTEGIATYLQEVLRARCGLQSAAVSWNRIRDGLERGRRSGTGRILTSESRDMNRTGAYFRVYWAGTAFALEADLRLRRESHGEMTLLRALDLAQPRLSGDLADAEEVLTVLDEVSGSDFLVELGARYASSARFPTTRLLDDPASKRIRRQIMKLEPNGCIGSSVESSR